MEAKNSTGTGSQPTGSIHEAAAIFEQSLTDLDEAGNPVEAEAKPDDQAPLEGAENQGSEEEAKPEGEEESEEQVESDEEAEQPAQVPSFTVRVDGKEEQVPLPELLAGYSRTADYTRKTQQVAEQRKAADAIAEAARQERTEYATLIPKLRAALEAGIGPEPDWDKLRAEDPTKANTLWQQRQEMKAKLATAKAEEQRVLQQQAEDAEAMANQVAIEQREKLFEKLPEWKDDKVSGAESEMIHQLMLSVGYSPEETKIYDHRAILIARKAALYDAAMARQAKVKKVVQNAPVNKAGAAVRTNKVTETQKAARSRFNSTGKVGDAANLFESFL